MVDSILLEIGIKNINFYLYIKKDMRMRLMSFIHLSQAAACLFFLFQ